MTSNFPGKVTTLVYTKGGGRFGNQLIRFLHWMAWARENEGRVRVVDLAFWQYANFFSFWRKHPGCVVPFPSRSVDKLARLRLGLPERLRRPIDKNVRLQRVVHLLSHLWPTCHTISLDDQRGERVDLNDPAFLERVMRYPVVTLSGWQAAGWQLVAKDQEVARRHFVPDPASSRLATDLIASLRSRYDLLIGVLIRQGDYRRWLGGRFYFDSAQYGTWVRQLRDIYAGKSLGVVLACDEHQDMEYFKGLPCYLSPGSVNRGGHWFESFAVLSSCDIVVCPPSTFAASAAFIRDIPIWPLKNAGQELDESQLMSNALLDAAVDPTFCMAVN